MICFIENHEGSFSPLKPPSLLHFIMGSKRWSRRGSPVLLFIFSEDLEEDSETAFLLNPLQQLAFIFLALLWRRVRPV